MCSQYVDIGVASREKRMFAYAKTKPQIGAFVFATRIVQFLFFLNPKFQASSLYQRLHMPVYVGPGRKTEDRVSHVAAHWCIFVPEYRSWDMLLPRIALESKIAKKNHLLLVKTKAKCGINLSYTCASTVSLFQVNTMHRNR